MKNKQNRLKQRAIQAAEEALSRQMHVCPIDVLVGMQLLHQGNVDAWRKGKFQYLEEMVQGSTDTIFFSLDCFIEWVKEKGLKPSPIEYFAKTSGAEKDLKFFKDGNPELDLFFKTHYFSPFLSADKQNSLQEKLDKKPELVVFRIVTDSQCSNCKKELLKGDFLFKEEDRPLCMCCGNLDEFLPRGNAKLTRRVTKNASKLFVVIKFSRTRKRYERQGILVEKGILKKVRQELMIADDDTVQLT
jgi:hypothetical protein